MLTAPYVTTAEFKAYPTFLDLQNLRSGDQSLADQDDELGNILLESSAWADSICNGGLPAAGRVLGAHQVVEPARLALRRGVLQFAAAHRPIRKVLGLSWGSRPGSLQAVADLSAVWIDPTGTVATADAQTLGTPRCSGWPSAGEWYTQWTYLAGWPATPLAADAAPAATTLTVADPTGILPGDVLRIWDPGVEEFVTVGAGYTLGSATVPLAAPLAAQHLAGAGLSGLPADVHRAVKLYTVASLLRPDTSREDAFPDDQLGPGTRKNDARKDGSGLVKEAERLLGPYRRVW